MDGRRRSGGRARAAALLAVTLAAVTLAAVTLAGAARAAEQSPAEVVQAFNRAMSERQLEPALALLAPGAVQYALRAAHAGVPPAAGGSLTGDLATHWKTIGPVLFAVTSRYERVPEILDARADGDLATVWARTTSTSVERSGKERRDSYSEVYLLVRTAGGWRIGAMADNRGTDRLAVGQPAP